ncbi:urease accessory protein UreD [Caenispirillum salinarum]|uniref:urease accessory protein UreD n=1 Tax=Caenispirillum salinarum TaxID=859058 RepID=UPI00068AE29C|nr:urease accessory protein UreD [Caenispirillum salinarum]
MYAVTSPSERAAAEPSRLHGLLHVSAGPRGLRALEQRAPLRALLPRVPPGEPLTACLTNTAGGLVGGDSLTVAVEAEPGGRLLAMAQAAEKVYRSLGPDVRMDVTLTAGEGAWLEWLPQETILFDAARLRRRTRLDVAEGGRALAGEMVVLGRTAHGETVRTGLLRDAWEVRVGGRLAWMDALHLEGDLRRAVDASSGFGGAVAAATAVFVGPDLEDLRDGLRDLPTEEGAMRGATVVGGVLVARWLGHDAQAMRCDFGRAWAWLRHRAEGLPEKLPRLWHV